MASIPTSLRRTRGHCSNSTWTPASCRMERCPKNRGQSSRRSVSKRKDGISHRVHRDHRVEECLLIEQPTYASNTHSELDDALPSEPTHCLTFSDSVSSVLSVWNLKNPDLGSVTLPARMLRTFTGGAASFWWARSRFLTILLFLDVVAQNFLQSSGLLVRQSVVQVVGLAVSVRHNALLN